MPGPATVERKYCRRCKGPRAWFHLGTENHDRPCAERWRCSSCGLTRIALADLDDAENFVALIVNGRLRSITDYGDVRSVEPEELLSYGWMKLCELYVAWQPERGVPFTAYASGLLPLRLNVWWRQNFSEGRRALAEAGFLDGDARAEYEQLAVVEAVEAWAGDPANDCDPALARILADGGRERAGDLRELGCGSQARANRRDEEVAA